MLSKVVVIGGGGETLSGGEADSSFFTLRFSGVSISGVESTSKSELDEPILLSVLRSGDKELLWWPWCFIGGGLLGGGDSEQVSLFESLMMRARFDPGNKVIIVNQRALEVLVGTSSTSRPSSGHKSAKCT